MVDRGDTGRDDRAARLAAALRVNLRRRKAQARGGADGGDPRRDETGDDEAPGGEQPRTAPGVDPTPTGPATDG